MTAVMPQTRPWMKPPRGSSDGVNDRAAKITAPQHPGSVACSQTAQPLPSAPSAPRWRRSGPGVGRRPRRPRTPVDSSAVSSRASMSAHFGRRGGALENAPIAVPPVASESRRGGYVSGRLAVTSASGWRRSPCSGLALRGRGVAPWVDMGEEIDVVVVGAGQAGLATSHELTARGVDHVVLESTVPGSSWLGRWDSFTLVGPNHTVRLPGAPYVGDDPERLHGTRRDH